MKRCKRLIVCMICLLMVCAFVLPVSGVLATETEQTSDLTIEFFHDGEAVSGAEFEIYKVGDMDEKGVKTLSGAFADYPVELNVATNAQYQAAADTLLGYIQSDAIEADVIIVTNEKGIARIDGLERGVYLVAAQPHEVEDGKYVSSPQLWTLPYRANTADPWTYSLKISTKSQFVPNPVEPVTVKVLKQWEDAGFENARPVSITVELLRDGEVYDTVVLTAENNWRYTWEDLAPEHEWTVVEEPVADYTVSITKEGITFLVKNTYEVPPTEPSEPPTEPPDIPQTGMTWWPVPLLAVVGLGLIVVGIVARRKEYDET